MECEAYGRLGIEWINIAQRGVRSHPGVRIDDQFAIVLFDRPATGETIAALWSFGQCAAVTSETMSFPLGMLFDWDWARRARRGSRVAPAGRPSTRFQHRYNRPGISLRGRRGKSCRSSNFL